MGWGGRAASAALPGDKGFGQRVRRQPVRTVDSGARSFADGQQTGNFGAPVHIGSDASAVVMRTGRDGDGLGARVDSVLAATGQYCGESALPRHLAEPGSVKQDVVAIVAEDAPLAQLTQTSCSELVRHPLIFRTATSSTQRVVDRGFRSSGLAPRPTMVLDTRDGVHEAVANGLGIGFMWEFGSSRKDGIRKLRVVDFEQSHPEHVFHLTGRASPLVRAFQAIQI